MKATVFIINDGGSKGLPGKEIHPLTDMPLIAWSGQWLHGAGAGLDRNSQLGEGSDGLQSSEAFRKH